MNSSPYQFIVFIWALFGLKSSALLFAQNDSTNHPCPPPSEHQLNLLLQQVISTTQHEDLQIGGLIEGPFTHKDQIDYVLWFQEQPENSPSGERKIAKLTCQNAQWSIPQMNALPPGVQLSKENFQDVTGDGIWECLYSFSYHTPAHCVDGCAVLSLEGESFYNLYRQEEKHPCQDIDWFAYQPQSELPFISYQLQPHKQGGEAGLEVKRWTKKYQKGNESQEVLNTAILDSSSTFLIYDRYNKRFVAPIEPLCHHQAFKDGQIDGRHPAVRLANKHLKRNNKQDFYVESVYRAHFSDKEQPDYLFCSNIFMHPVEKIPKRKAIKISCAGNIWKVKGLVYVNPNFSEKDIQDVNGDGIDEIIDQSTQIKKQHRVQIYRILSFIERVGQLVYMHKNHLPLETKQAQNMDWEYSIQFKDLDKDGQKELIQKSSKGKQIFVYDPIQKCYIKQR